MTWCEEFVEALKRLPCAMCSHPGITRREAEAHRVQVGDGSVLKLCEEHLAPEMERLKRLAR